MKGKGKCKATLNRFYPKPEDESAKKLQFMLISKGKSLRSFDTQKY